MSLLLGAQPYSGWESLKVVLDAIGCDVEPSASLESRCLSVEPLASGEALVLLYEQPIITLARALEQGLKPSEAEENWLRHAKALLQCFKAHRQQTALVYVSAGLVAPQKFAQSVCQRLGLSVPQGVAEGSLAPASTPEPMSVLLATHIVQASKSIQRLARELDACALPLIEAQGQPPSLDLDAQYTAHNQLIAMNAELELSIQQSKKQAQQECEQLEQELKQAQQQAELAHTDAEARLQAVEASLASSREEDQLAVDQMLALQQAFELEVEARQAAQQQAMASEEALAEANKALDAAEAECARLKQRIEQLKETASWKQG